MSWLRERLENLRVGAHRNGPGSDASPSKDPPSALPVGDDGLDTSETGPPLKQEVTSWHRTPEARALAVCAISIVATVGLVYVSVHIDDHSPVFKNHPISSGAYELFLATQVVGLGILFGIYFTTVAVLLSADPSLLGSLIPRFWFAVPGTVIVYSMAVLAIAGFSIRPFHGAFIVLLGLDLLAFLAFWRLFSLLHRTTLGSGVRNRRGASEARKAGGPERLDRGQDPESALDPADEPA